MSETAASDTGPQQRVEPDFRLHAHDKVEGSSEAGRAVFAEICDRLSGKVKHKLHLHRILKGDAGSEKRRVTRDVMVKAMEAAGIENGEREKLWERYFGGPPQSIAEHVRRRIIRTGGIDEYAEFSGVNRQTLWLILEERALTHATLERLLSTDIIPWEQDDLEAQWRRERTEYLMRTRSLNELGALVEAIFETRPQATRVQWVDLDNPPASLKEFSQNQRRIMMSALRHGRITTWEEADRILFGMECTLRERVEVADAWLREQKKAPTDHASGPEDGEADTRDRGGTAPVMPLDQYQEAYPEDLRGLESLEAIAKLLAQYEGASGSREQSDELRDRVHTAVVRSSAVSAVQIEQAAEDDEKEYDQFNVQRGTRIQELRRSIAEAWPEVEELLFDTEIKENEKLTDKVLKKKFMSADLLKDIARIIQEPSDHAKKFARLVAILSSIREQVFEIQTLRNELALHNGGIIGAFFSQRHHLYLCADLMPLDDRKQAASIAFLRSCERFDPSIGRLATLAFTAMYRDVIHAAMGDKKHRHVRSLDRPVRSRKDDGSTLGELIGSEDYAAQKNAETNVSMQAVRDFLGTLDPALRATAELRWGLNSERRIYDPKEAADALNRAGIPPPEFRGGRPAKSFSAERVRLYEKFVLKQMVKFLREQGHD
jgi:hypothetical protein